MPSVTSWTRLEPRCRTEDPGRSLQARVHDPLWLLARQWQFGEFHGEDAGSPVIARFRMEAAPVTRYALGDQPIAAGGGIAYDVGQIPLETLVEREPVRADVPNYEQAVEAGLHFLRRLTAAAVSGPIVRAFAEAYRLKALENGAMDDDARLLILATRQAPNGAELYRVLRQTLRPARGGPPELPLDRPTIRDAAERTRVLEAATEWLAWYEGLFSVATPGESAWRPERLEYRFAVSAGAAAGELVLEAPEYAGGRLEWHDFTVASGRSLGAVPDSGRPEKIHTVMPAPATFRGMPANRWWEFEDAQVDLGMVSAEPQDLARLVLVEFALIYGNDWFIIPIDVPVGSLCIPRSLVVTDTFGVRTLVSHYKKVDGPSGRWRMFDFASTSAQGMGDQPFATVFFLPPVLAASLEAEPLEDVLLLRDEMANMVWAIERVVASVSGRPLRRSELYQQLQERERERRDREGSTSPPPARLASRLSYRLMSSIPDHWIPFLPEKIDQHSIRLRRGGLLLPDGAIAPDTATGRILEPVLVLFEEEVPRSGTRVSRAYQYARWIDGSTHVWIGRRKQFGHGEGSSGLRFDLTERITE